MDGEADAGEREGGSELRSGMFEERQFRHKDSNGERWVKGGESGEPGNSGLDSGRRARRIVN